MEGSETVAIAVRAVERLITVGAGLALIIMGYFMSRRRGRKDPQGEVSLQHGSLGGLMIKNQGPGFLILALGTALLAFSLMHGTLTFGPGHSIERFFSNSDADRARYSAEITQMRLLEGLCVNKALPLVVDCASLKSARKALATSYFPKQREKFDSLPKGATDIPPELSVLFGG